MNVKKFLTKVARDNHIDAKSLHLPDCDLDADKIKVVMISEVPPHNPDDGFYSNAAQPDYLQSTLGLFAKADVNVHSMRDILELGIYITTAVKTPKTEYAVPAEIIKAQLPLLAAEIDLFPRLKAIMLMGDVAKKAVNMIAKARTGKNVIPAGSTYKIRGNEFYWDDIRVFPSYIITGGNILIEKSKCAMIADDIRRMTALLGA